MSIVELRKLVAVIDYYSSFEDWQNDIIPFKELEDNSPKLLEEYYKKADLIIAKMKTLDWNLVKELLK